MVGQRPRALVGFLALFLLLVVARAVVTGSRAEVVRIGLTHLDSARWNEVWRRAEALAGQGDYRVSAFATTCDAHGRIGTTILTLSRALPGAGVRSVTVTTVGNGSFSFVVGDVPGPLPPGVAPGRLSALFQSPGLGALFARHPAQRYALDLGGGVVAPRLVLRDGSFRPALRGGRGPYLAFTPLHRVGTSFQGRTLFLLTP